MAGSSIVYFGSDRMVYLVLHPGQPSLTTGQVDELITWSNRRATEILQGLEKEPLIKRTADNPLLSLARREKANFPTGDPPDGNAQEHFRPDVAAPEAFTVLLPEVVNVSRANLVRLAMGLDDQRSTFKSGRLELSQVSLNWLTSVTNGGLGSGGPGGEPTAYAGRVATSHPFTLLPRIEGLLPRSVQERGYGVEVAILDTSPTDSDLNAARAGVGRQHPLLGPLLGGQLDRPPATVNPARHNIYHLRHHHYNMADHGLFAAGIIHSIAPRAKLHLIEVLNNYGVGDIESIAGGLVVVADVIAQQVDRGNPSKWVVNASLMMNAPTDEIHLGMMIEELKDQGALTPAEKQEQGDLLNLLQTEASNPSSTLIPWLKTRQSGAIQLLCDYIYALGTRVIAAAGNDWTPKASTNTNRPESRFPARAPSVLGVGALRKLERSTPITPATYSNIADLPASAGVVTFGGEEGADQGVLGAYIGKFPPAPGKANSNGWAWWCGTSFATPIVSGMTAALLGTDHYKTTENATEEFFKEPRELLPVTNEDILRVTQQ